MKKIFLLPFFFLVAFMAGAQNAAVTNAILLHKDGELDKAREQIDKAAQDEKTQTQPKTWYYRGLIYTDLLKTTNPNYKVLSENPLEEAVNSFIKASELDDKKGEYYKLSETKLNELWGEAVNAGVANYENNKYPEALKNYEIAQKVKPADTTAFVYALYAAEEMGRNDLLKKYAQGLSATGYKSVYLYQQLIRAAKADKDNAKAVNLANQALTDFPENAALTFDRALLYLETNNNKGALQDLLTLSRLKPNNPDYLLYIGSLYEKEKDDIKALDYYNKVLAIDPKNVTANYNIASIWYSKGKEVMDRVNSNQNIHSHHTSGKETEKEGKDYLLKAYDYAQASFKAAKEETDQKDAQDMMNKINKALNRPAPQGESLH